MNLFTDTHHHAGLNYSMRLLAKRLGVELFTPTGMEWATEGYWQIHKPYNYDEGTARQFLQIKPEYTLAPSLPLNRMVAHTSHYYEYADLYHGDTQKSMTLEQFKDMEIDVIIASIPDHYETFKQLRDKYKPNAKFVVHIGNILWHELPQFQDGSIKNLLASVAPFPINHTTHAIFYHQETPTTLFKAPDYSQQTITSLTHLLPGREHFIQLQSHMQEFQWKAYGAGAIDGIPNTLTTMVGLMEESLFGYHNKPGGDGFGHVIHSWGMVGRPVIINYETYKNQLAGQFLIPDVTCIPIEQDIQALIQKIKYFSEPERHRRMCLAMRKAWEQAVNYDTEGQKLKEFFATLQ